MEQAVDVVLLRHIWSMSVDAAAAVRAVVGLILASCSSVRVIGLRRAPGSVGRDTLAKRLLLLEFELLLLEHLLGRNHDLERPDLKSNLL